VEGDDLTRRKPVSSVVRRFIYERGLISISSRLSPDLSKAFVSKRARSHKKCGNQGDRDSKCGTSVEGARCIAILSGSCARG